MNNQKDNELKEISGVSAAGASAGAVLAAATGIPLAIPVALGAGICCLAYAGIKAFK